MAELDVPSPIARGAGAPLRIEAVGMEALSVIRAMNEVIFGEERVINTFEREGLVMLVAWWEGAPAGFKIGYRVRPGTFYSAKGGVLPAFRRRGIARGLLRALMRRARAGGYRRFTYDTFPNKHPGMTVLGLAEGFHVVKAGYNAQHGDYRLRFQKRLV